MTIKDFLSTTKRKLSVGIISGALIISAGAMTAFAAKAVDTDKNTPSDGNTQYSLDEGQTWSEETPDGAQVTVDGGKVTVQVEAK